MVINVTWIPVIALSIAALLLVLRAFGGGVRPTYTYNRGNPVWGLLFCIIGLVFCGVMAVSTGMDLHAYKNDPACAAGFAASAPYGSSLCTTQSAAIVGHEVVYGRRSHTLYVDLDLGGDRVEHAALYRAPGAFWAHIRDGKDTRAVVQLYRGRLVAIETFSGTAETQSHPAAKNQTFELTGAVIGGFGVICALAMAFRSSGFAF